MTHGYLLDTSILSLWFDLSRRSEHADVLKQVDALPPDSPLAVSAVTLGEIEYGHRAESRTGYTPVQVEFNDFVREQCPMILPIRETTAADYGQLRAALFEKYGKKGRKTRWPEQLVDPATSHSLGIQENDLWIVAQAMEYRLVLVTHDKMTHIRSIATDLQVEDWTH